MGMAVAVSDKQLTNRRRRRVSTDRMTARRREGRNAAASSSKAREGDQGELLKARLAPLLTRERSGTWPRRVARSARARQSRLAGSPVTWPRPRAASSATHAQSLLSAPPLCGPSLPPQRRPEPPGVATCAHARRRAGPPSDVTAHSERSGCSLPVSRSPSPA